jgi:hypothetical protein
MSVQCCPVEGRVPRIVDSVDELWSWLVRAGREDEFDDVFVQISYRLYEIRYLNTIPMCPFAAA